MGRRGIQDNAIQLNYMADNYLEKKMEDLRSGRLAGVKPNSSLRRGVWCVPFPCRRVFVTGGARGIGRAIVEEFSRIGCKVAFCDADEVSGAETAYSTGARFIHADVSDTDALKKSMDILFTAWRDIDIIINNVGVGDFKPFGETTAEDFQKVIDVNLKPVFVTAHALAAHRESLPYPNDFGGRIINIASTRHMQSEAGTVAYSASKGGVVSLTHSLMMDMSKYRITVNSISPGWIETGDYDLLRPEDHSQHPSGRVGRPADVARLCVFLSAVGNDFINGADIPVDGGMTRKMIYID